jgi:hypothetical protein
LKASLSIVMPAPVAGIRVLVPMQIQDVDGRDEPGHDDIGNKVQVY